MPVAEEEEEKKSQKKRGQGKIGKLCGEAGGDGWLVGWDEAATASWWHLAMTVQVTVKGRPPTNAGNNGMSHVLSWLHLIRGNTMEWFTHASRLRASVNRVPARVL